MAAPENAPDAPPLILTLKMDDASQERFDRLRRAHFPPERNFLPAHLTLFHKLPGDREGEVVSTIQDVCRTQGSITMRATGVRSLGRGVAYELDPGDLAAVRRRLAAEWEPWLTPQDRQGFKPHVTVQNKVAPEAARALLQQLRAGFSPFEVGAEGLLLWRYMGGPWEAVGAYGFGG